MPRFFFHLHDGVFLADEEGVELPEVEAARRSAVADIRSITADRVLKGVIATDMRIDIADEAGGVVASVDFRDAVTIEA